MKLLIAFLFTITLGFSSSILSDSEIKDIQSQNKKEWVNYFQSKYQDLTRSDIRYINSIHYKYHALFSYDASYAKSRFDRRVKELQRDIETFQKRNPTLANDQLIESLLNSVDYNQVVKLQIDKECKPLTYKKDFRACQQLLKRVKKNRDFTDTSYIAPIEEKIASIKKELSHFYALKPSSCRNLNHATEENIEKLQKCIDEDEAKLSNYSKFFSLFEREKEQFTFNIEQNKKSIKRFEKMIAAQNQSDKENYMMYGAVVFGIIILLILSNIAAKKRKKEEERVAREKEQARLDALPKCDSCFAPLDPIHETYSMELQETRYSDVVAKHESYEFYQTYRDERDIYRVCCKNCEHCFEQEEIKKDVYLDTVVECINCQSFDTNYTIEQNSDKTAYIIECSCNACHHEWRAQEKEQSLQKSYEERVAAERERKLQEERAAIERERAALEREKREAQNAQNRASTSGSTAASRKCIYCGGGGSPGMSCHASPTKKHIIHVEGICSYCGASGSAGMSCASSPTGKHVIMKPGKCSYCGSSGSVGMSCSSSPTGKHVRGVFE